MSFTLQLQAFAAKAVGNYHAVVFKVVLDVGTSLVFKSPVGDAKYWKRPAPKGYTGGRFRGNWQHGEGSANTTVTDTIDKEGGGSIDRIAASIGVEPGGKVHYITNSLPYSKRLEDGWSRQAPNGMVRLTFLEFEQMIFRAVAGLP